VLANKILTIFIIHLIIVLSKTQQLKDHLSALLCNFKIHSAGDTSLSF